LLWLTKMVLPAGF